MIDLITHGEIALAAMDRALACQPVPDASDFTDATTHLVVMRDRLVDRCRDGADCHDLLMRVNAVISCSLGGHFPLGKVPWPLIRSARTSLHDMLAQVKAE